MIKHLFTAICLAFSIGLSSHAQAQGDSCTATCSFNYQTDSSGQTVFTGQAFGVTDPLFVWYVNGNASGSGAIYTGAVVPGDEVCLETTGYSYYYDSLQQWTDIDTCYAIYCDIIGWQDSSDCNLQAWYTYGTNPNGVTTFTGNYSGSGQASYGWTVNGNYVGNGQSTYSGVVPAGSEVCFYVSTWSYFYDSLTQQWDSDTCEAIYCEIIGWQDSSDCNLQAWYTYETNPNGVTTFTGNYSGSGQASYGWTVNGNYVGNGQSTYSGVVPAGSEVCFYVSTWSYFYDSLTQQWDSDTCEAIYCEIIGWQDSSDCNLQAWYTYETNPNGVTTFTGNYSGTNDPQFFWIVNGNYVGGNQSTYTANLPAGTEVCFEVRSYTITYDSLQQWTIVDTCFVTYCQTLDQTAGLPDNERVTFTLYPNPATTTFSVLISTELSAARVSVLDVNGRVVLVTDKLDAIDVSALQQGVYYVKITDAEDHALTGIQRFVKE